MDYQLKGFILNHTLKSYAITLVESANVLKVTMKFYGVISTGIPARGAGTGSGRKGSWPSSGRILFWCQCPSSKPGQSPHPVSLGGLVLATMEAALHKQVHVIEEQIKGVSLEVGLVGPGGRVS